MNNILTQKYLTTSKKYMLTTCKIFTKLESSTTQESKMTLEQMESLRQAELNEYHYRCCQYDSDHNMKQYDFWFNRLMTLETSLFNNGLPHGDGKELA